MQVVIDIEANGLKDPTQIWVIVCKDIDTNSYHIFRNVTSNNEELNRFISFSNTVDCWIGHNFISYDLPVIQRLTDTPAFRDSGHVVAHTLDTLVVSKLIDYPRQGHSVEHYGEEFGLLKGFKVEDGSILESKYFPQSFFLQYSKDLENYCIRDVEITHRIYLKYLKYISKEDHKQSIDLEQRFQLVVNELSNNGFYFNRNKAITLLSKVTEELSILDKDITEAFPPRLKLIRTVTPRSTKYGTISLTSIPKALRADIANMSVGAPFSYCAWTSFNPSSHSQIVQVLNEAAWVPVDKTQTHIDTERELNKLKHTRQRSNELDIQLRLLYDKLNVMKKVGWKVNETNLETLPRTAPLSARSLAKRILLESRRRTLTEWLGLLAPDGRIHGKFYGIGAWTHRMAHQNPNTANIPNAVKVSDGSTILYGKELRSMWCAPKNRLLVGVDAEAIQLRVFAHLINDPNLTNAIVNGKKSEGTDPHSLNRTYFGSYCKTRNAAKHSLYAMFFGGGPNKIAQIMGCSREEAEEAIQSLIEKYPGLLRLQREVFPIDAKRGYFIGLDNRKVRIPGDTVSNRKHLCMSGYLQNGEAVIMKKATLKWNDLLKQDNAILVNLVHDEWQTEVPNNMEVALRIAETQADSLRIVGEELNLNCPLAGSYYNDDDKDYTIATNWSKTH